MHYISVYKKTITINLERPNNESYIGWGLSMSAVIFDLFETLVTEWGRPKYTTCQIAEDLNVDYRTFLREWKKLHMDRYSGKLSGTTQVLKLILKNLSIDRDENLLIEVSRKRDDCKRKCFETIEPRILGLLSTLKEKGYKIGLISNCSTEEIEWFWDSALYNFFDVIILSCEVGIVKPDLEIYQNCLSLLDERPSKCFYIGDGGSDELNGANRAGMIPLRALWFINNIALNSDVNFPTFVEPSEIVPYISVY